MNAELVESLKDGKRFHQMRARHTSEKFQRQFRTLTVPQLMAKAGELERQAREMNSAAFHIRTLATQKFFGSAN